MPRSVRFPPRPKPPHYRGSYHVRAMALRQAANADPTTTCWRCHRTRAQFMREDKPDKNGKPAHWTAGHVVDGQVGGPLLPECSTCNRTHGAKTGNARSQTNAYRSEDW